MRAKFLKVEKNLALSWSPRPEESLLVAAYQAAAITCLSNRRGKKS